jgi:nucleoside diphosphate kinase
VVLNDTIKNEYLPELAKFAQLKGLKLLATAMTHQEGFNPNTRSYATHNPGNIGNTDSGANKKLGTLYDGIKLQLDKLTDIANGKLAAYPINKQVVIKPYYSEEIARNCVKYQKSPYVPGYRFLYTGELQQFIKIYATGARSGNGYLNTIISYFEQNGYKITGATTLHEIINLM